MGVSFRPVSVEAQLYLGQKDREILTTEDEVYASKKMLKKFKKKDRERKKIQLEASLKKGLESLVKEMKGD